MPKGTSEAPVLPESKLQAPLEGYLYGAEASVSGSRGKLLREDKAFINTFCPVAPKVNKRTWISSDKELREKEQKISAKALVFLLFLESAEFIESFVDFLFYAK